MRLLALGLTVLWAATALAVAAAYRPGGPLDIVVIVRRPLGDQKAPAILGEWRRALPRLRRAASA